MKTQQKPWLVGIAVCAFALFLNGGCANKGTAENEQADGYSESSAEAGEAAGETTADGASMEATEAELFGEGDPAAAGDLSATASTDPNASADPAAAGGDPAMETLFDPDASQAHTEPNFDELAGGDPAADVPADGGSRSAVGGTETAGDAAASETPLTDPATSSAAQAFADSASTFGDKPSYSGAVVPNIPGRAVTRKGKSLNRYYFLRSGDNSQTVSELIYGNGSLAGDLKKWNKGRWLPGKVIYYSSPTQPDDGQMISFYDERSLSPEEYTVGRGESMSAIAKKKLGHLSSWKEIAVTNGLSSPDTLRRHQKIRLYTDLGRGGAQYAQGGVTSTPAPPQDFQPPPNTPPTESAPPVDPGSASPPPEIAASAPVQPPVDNLSTPMKKSRKPGLNIMKLLTQEAFSLSMGLGIALLLISLVMINRKKKASGGIEEFNEDAFGVPGKKKRR